MSISESNPDELLIRLGWQLVDRLERLSVDSFWAHRASGLRRTLIRALEDLHERPEQHEIHAKVEYTIRQGFAIVENAAREIGDRK